MDDNVKDMQGVAVLRVYNRTKQISWICSLVFSKMETVEKGKKNNLLNKASFRLCDYYW